MPKPSPRKPGRASIENDRVDGRAAKLQQEFDRLHHQVRRLQTLASMGTTAATLAHEINNLMTPVLGYAKFALKENDPELMAKALRTTLDQIESVVTMTDRILTMAADRPTAIQPVGLRSVVNDAVLATCRDPSKDGITLTVEIDDSISVQADARRLQQVFFNLLLNARDALAGRTGRITIRAAIDSDDSVNVTFADTGSGIPAEMIDTVFEPFVTTKDSTTKHRGGTGLGLSLCRDILRDHGGGITVESRAGHGATFTVTLPRAPKS
ncbi:MAG: HAMP domain-containing histidine kinase [Phycisphaerales bacterium]|nr:HAMP domain-containing histidine kinase [Phycisphaerales bacterium]